MSARVATGSTYPCPYSLKLTCLSLLSLSYHSRLSSLRTGLIFFLFLFFEKICKNTFTMSFYFEKYFYFLEFWKIYFLFVKEPYIYQNSHITLKMYFLKKRIIQNFNIIMIFCKESFFIFLLKYLKTKVLIWLFKEKNWQYLLVKFYPMSFDLCSKHQ